MFAGHGSLVAEWSICGGPASLRERCSDTECAIPEARSLGLFYPRSTASASEETSIGTAQGRETGQLGGTLLRTVRPEERSWHA
jgi:hypothetical protein